VSRHGGCVCVWRVWARVRACVCAFERESVRLLARVAGVSESAADGRVERVGSAPCAWPGHADRGSTSWARAVAHRGRVDEWSAKCVRACSV
jgi:hypothetical protein